MKNMMWACMLQLGMKMWPGHTDTKMEFERPMWDELTAELAAAGCNTILLDIGEGLKYDSYPEISAEDAWTKEEMKAEITRLKAIIDNAVVVSENEINTDNVSVGTTVKYVNVATGKEAEYGIVGADEADPLKGLISNESPIGMALLGHKVGETVEVEIPKGFLSLRIVDIHR